MRTARIAVAVVFAIHGIASGTWICRIPAVQETLGLDVGELGLALLGGGLGSLLALIPTGALIGLHGSRGVTRWTGLAACAVLAVLGGVSNGLTLFAALVAWGASAGSLDVAMNAQGSTIEQRGGRPIMSTLHGLWSSGCLAGAATGPLLTGAGVSFRVHFAVTGLALALAVLVASGRLVRGDEEGGRSAPIAWPRGSLLPLAAVVFCAVAVEGAMLDWGGVFLRRVLDAPEAIAAAAGAVFSVAMAVGRLSGDYLVARFPRPVIARTGAALAGLGVASIIVAPAPEVVFAGLIATGFGLAALVPLAFAAAGRDRATSTGAGIAAVATVGYTVLMVGPPTIGLIAQRLGLRGAFTLLPLLLVCVLALAPALEHHPSLEAAGH